MLDKNVVIGYDLGDYNCQISYYYLDSEEPETITTIAGGEQFNIPTVLCKQSHGDYWIYGKEAYDYQEEGVLVSKLLSLAESEQDIMISENKYSTFDLLKLFIEKSLTLLTPIIGNKKIEAVSFTLSGLNLYKLELLKQVVKELKLKTQKITFHDKEEAFFAYMLNQELLLWKKQVIVCDVSEGFLSIMRLEMNRNTVPTVAFVEKTEFEELDFSKIPKTVVAKEEFLKKQDSLLSEILESLCKTFQISSFYLIGDAFRENWYNETLQTIGKGKRIFQGNNMYSKGACFLAKEQLEASKTMAKHVFLGSEKVKANVGMKIIRNGKEAYLVLLDGGQNWFDLKKEYDVILETDNIITFQIMSLRRGEIKFVDVILSGLPVRPKKASRVNVLVDLISEYRMRVQVKDMGFGELYPATGMVWTEEIDIT